MSSGKIAPAASASMSVEYIVTPFTYACAHAEPDTRAIVGKRVRGSWSPFWGGVRPPHMSAVGSGAFLQHLSTCD
eukprot:scaffold108306_cov69-Cyclotella_meneghiniana.AAC.2